MPMMGEQPRGEERRHDNCLLSDVLMGDESRGIVVAVNTEQAFFPGLINNVADGGRVNRCRLLKQSG